MLPTSINSGPWITAYTLDSLRRLPRDTQFILPICDLETPDSQLQKLGDWILPPLFQEALDQDLKRRMVERIQYCFPRYGQPAENARCLRIVEVTGVGVTGEGASPQDPTGVLAFSVDTAVEEHGPHLPLATDTLQSYSVLEVLTQRFDRLSLGPPVDYGQLTWGLPFGFSIDLTAELVTKYVSRLAPAFQQHFQAEALYVVDVHGSITHRQAIVEGLRQSGIDRWGFRWLHEPLAEFASARGDQHAGGVETALLEYRYPQLLDPAWWPERIDELAAGQMSFEKAVALTPNLSEFIEYVDHQQCNGIIGDILNYRQLNATELFNRMLQVAHADVEALLAGKDPTGDAGKQLW